MPILNIKLASNTATHKIDVDFETQVEKIKEIIEEKTKIPKSAQKLISKGKILANDKTLTEQNITENQTVIVLGSANKTGQPPKPSAENEFQQQAPQSNESFEQAAPPYYPTNMGPADMGGMPDMGGLGGFPDMQNMMNDPSALLRTMQNPVVQEMMSNIMRNPETMRAVLQNSRMFQDPNNPQMSDQMRRMAENPELMQSVMQMFAAPAPGAQTAPAPNFAPFAASARPAASAPAGAANAAALETKYRAELEQLSSMGFFDKAKNLQLLEAASGNISVVIEGLLEGA